MFCITPEAFNAIDMLSFNRIFPANYYMTSFYTQWDISLPVIREVQAPGFCIGFHQCNHIFMVALRDWQYTQCSNPFKGAEDDDPTCSSPASLTHSTTTELYIVLSCSKSPSKGSPHPWFKAIIIRQQR